MNHAHKSTRIASSVKNAMHKIHVHVSNCLVIQDKIIQTIVSRILYVNLVLVFLSLLYAYSLIFYI